MKVRDCEVGMTFLESLLILIGRICISAFFFWSAIEKMKNWHQTANFMRMKKVPHVNLVLPIAIGLKILSAVLILIGFLPRLGALLLILLMGPATIRFHDFWTFHGPERIVEQNLFIKDIAIIGGLLFLLAMGGGTIAF